MATKATKQNPARINPKHRDKATRETLQVSAKRSDPKPYEAIAAQITNTTTGAATAMQRIDGGEWLDVNALVEVLKGQAKAASAGDMSQPEAMLLAQAQTLEALFYRFTRSGIAQTTIPQFEAHFRLALKAQSQCRMALEALAEIKNPRSVAFVKQANIASGDQQVNNGVNPTIRAGACARENEIQQNKLLTDTSYETLDAGRTRTTSGVNSPLEAVGTVNRCENNGGQG